MSTNGLGLGLANVRTDVTNLTSHGPDGPIAYISCEPSAYTGFVTMDTIIQKSISSNASAILLYSPTSNFCALSSNLSDTYNTYGKFYSMTNSNVSASFLDFMNRMNMYGYLSGYRIGTIQAAMNAQGGGSNNTGGNIFTQNNEPGTNIAMIILYSITGVIALLFVIIIVTGAVRAHRHPERYGPRNVTGRPRQTRAFGIGRAMLETLPLVKFGETTPQKTADVEMTGVSPASGERDATATEHAEPKDGETGRDATSDGAAGATITKADASGKDAQGMDHQTKVEKSLECAICWEDFNKGEEVRMLPCEHKFHPACIDPWLLGFSGTCPVCRVDFGSKKKEEEDESEAGAGSGAASRSSQQPPPRDHQAQ